MRVLEIRPEPAQPGEEAVYDPSGVGRWPLSRSPDARRSGPRDAGWILRAAETEDAPNAARAAGASWDGTVLPCLGTTGRH